ncbi:MAG: type II secretion system protein [Planctomycetes bacterium]|nr:type II secretion system protein [Planctomycetota bacterium]
MKIYEDRKKERGMTLLELQIASAIMAVVMVAALAFIANMTTASSLEVKLVSLERELQNSLDDVVMDVKESKPSMMDIYDFHLNDPDATWQTAVCFPTARKMGTDEFVYTNDAGEVQVSPQWQGVVVYAPLYEPAYNMAWLVKYVDYTPRNYTTGMPRISNITEDFIYLTDGTVFDRDADAGLSGNQLVKRLTGHLVQFVRSPSPTDPAVYPLSFKLVANAEISEMYGEKFTVTSSTSVLARNNN